MKRLLLAIPAVFLLQACVTNDCERLAYKEAPQSAAPLEYPADVHEPTPSGEFQLPDVEGALAGDCLAQPPMTLPPEALEEEGEEDESAGE